MRNLLFVLLALIPFALSADARIETADNFCHVPYDVNNADNENYLSDCGSVLHVFANGARAHGQARATRENVTYSLTPFDEEDLPSYGTASFTLNGDELATPCTMVDSNGTNYVTNNWSIRIGVTRTATISRADVLYIVECWGGVAQ